MEPKEELTNGVRGIGRFLRRKAEGWHVLSETLFFGRKTIYRDIFRGSGPNFSIKPSRCARRLSYKR